MAPLHHEDLNVWRTAVDLVIAAHNCVDALPRRYAFEYGDQIRRAAVSVAANIAEGAARKSRKEFIQFLYIARGSTAELHTLFIVLGKLNLAEKKELDHVAQLLNSIGRMLTNLIKSLS